MQFIKKSDDRAKIKEEKDRKTELVKKEAVKNLQKKQKKNKNENEKIVTRLTCTCMVTRLRVCVM